MRRELHVRFCEGGGVQLPSATRLVVGVEHRGDAERFLAELRFGFRDGYGRFRELFRIAPVGGRLDIALTYSF